MLSVSIPESFSNIEVLLLYVRPLVSPLDTIHQGRTWISQNICMQKMAELCEWSFSWGGTMEIIVKFINIVWDGVCFRQLLEVCQSTPSHKRYWFYFKFALQRYNHDDVMVPLSMFHKARRLPRMLDLGLGNVYNVTVNISHLNQQLSLHLCQPASQLEVCSLSSVLRFCYFSCHCLLSSVISCLYVCIMVRLSSWTSIFLCWLCLRTSMMFLVVLSDSVWLCNCAAHGPLARV